MHPQATLEDILLDLYRPAELSRWLSRRYGREALRDLSDPDRTHAATWVHEAVDLLDRRGKLLEVIEAVAAEHGHRAAELRAVAARLETPTEPSIDLTALYQQARALTPDQLAELRFLLEQQGLRVDFVAPTGAVPTQVQGLLKLARQRADGVAVFRDALTTVLTAPPTAGVSMSGKYVFNNPQNVQIVETGDGVIHNHAPGVSREDLARLFDALLTELHRSQPDAQALARHQGAIEAQVEQLRLGVDDLSDMVEPLWTKHANDANRTAVQRFVAKLPDRIAWTALRRLLP
ncbi:MAG: hypothetical protein H6739_27825 [Alphaproteobacteria bacterium]|nr:hypothetical protein [Alphaproteobacteria bacterium]